MKIKKEYLVLSAFTIPDLESKVNSFLPNAELVGGVHFSHDTYRQAILKIEEVNEEVTEKEVD